MSDEEGGKSQILEGLGDIFSGCGCILTILVTIPIIILIFIL